MKRERVVGLDVLRWVCFLPVIMFHFLEAVWGSHKGSFQLVMATDPLFWKGVYVFMRALSFSGFSILFITTFLMGLTSNRRRINWPVILLLPMGWIVFCLVYDHFKNIYFFWDIYPLIAFGLLLVQMTFRYTRLSAVAGAAVGVLLLCVPFWKWQGALGLSLPAEMILIGNCDTSLASWPLLPWVGLILFGYSMGQMFHEKLWAQGGAFNGCTMGVGESFFWAGALLVSPFFWGAYFKVNLFSLYVFDCLTFRQAPWIFWAHLVWVVFFARICLLPRVQAWMKGNLALVSRFATSRHFGIIYFYSFILSYLIAWAMGGALRATPQLFTLILIIYWVLVEVTCQGGIILFRRLLQMIRSQIIRLRMNGRLPDERGVSLIEVLAASAIGLVVMLAFVSLMTAQEKTARETAQTFEIASVRSRITESLSENAACLQNFGNVTPNSLVPLSSLKNRAGAIAYQVGNDFGGQLVTLQSIARQPANPPAAPNTKGTFDLEVIFRKRGGYLGSQDVPVDIPVFFMTDAANRIQSCSTQGTAGNMTCVYPSKVCNGCHNLDVSCPPGYTLVGGGIEDGDTSKKAFSNRPYIPGTPGYPAGGWNCFNQDPGTMICTAICCQ